MIYRNILLNFTMILATGFALWLTYFFFQPQTNLPLRTSALPDGYMDGVRATIMDKFGKVKMKINSPHMVHYAANDTTHLTSPHLVIYRQSPQPWYITAQFAKATQGIENVDFWEDVVIHHAADESNPATVIKTTTLTVHPNKQIAETKEMITLLQPNLMIKSQGMQADMNTGDIKLLSQARGEYVPS